MTPVAKLVTLGLIATGAYLLHEKDVEIKQGIRVLTPSARKRVSAALRGTTLGEDTGGLTGVFAMRVMGPEGEGPDTIRFLDIGDEEGTSHLFTESVLQLQPGQDPFPLNIIVIATEDRSLAAEGSSLIAFN